MRPTRKSWVSYFLELAALAASRSEDPSTQVGCVIVGPDNEVRATGYNGLPRGVKAHSERLERPTKYAWVAHAEANAIANAARSGAALAGCTAYVTHPPCDDCARLLIQAGITAVMHGPGQTAMPTGTTVARAMFAEANVAVGQVSHD